MASGGELRGFVFAMSFIIIFAALVSTIPLGLQGEGTTAEIFIPVDPSLVTDFTDSEDYTRTDFVITLYQYDALGGYDWIAGHTAIPSFNLGAKILIGGILWLGGISLCEFISSDGTNRGNTLTIDEIETDALDGTVRYSLIFEDNGNSAGGFVVYWNTTTYSDPSDAWDNDELVLLHGVGLGATSTNNIGALLVGLLFFQLPDVPVLVNALLATPIWACVIFILWFIIKEMIPFV